MIVQLDPAATADEQPALVKSAVLTALVNVRLELVEVLVTVTDFVLPTWWKVNEVGDTAKDEVVEPLTAVPVRPTIPVTPIPLNVALRVPEAPVGGENVTVRVQVELAATEEHPLDEKSVALVPAMENTGVTKDKVVLSMPTVRELVEPSLVLGKPSELAVNVTEPVEPVVKKSDMLMGAVRAPFGFDEAPGNSVNPRASSIKRSTLSW